MNLMESSDDCNDKDDISSGESDSEPLQDANSTVEHCSTQREGSESS